MMLIDDIYSHLTSFGAYSQSGVTYTIRKYDYPDTPDTVIALIEFPAGGPVRAMGPSLSAPVRERAGLLVLVRGPQRDVANARAMAEVVHQRLDGLQTTISTRRYSVTAMHAPILKEQDRNSRWKIEMNYVVSKERG